MRMQAWVYFVTWIQYAANHITRKCYTNVKNVMIKLGLSKMVLGRMDAGFMFTYAFGAPLAGQLGDMYDPSMVLGVGLYGSAACIFMLIFGMWNHLGESGPFVANTYFLGVYLVFGFFQAIGGPVGTAIMGNWMVTPEARRNRGLIYGTWTTHQYLGNIIAPVIIVLCNISHAKWWWGLMWPVFINAGWGLVCHFALPATPEAHARKEAAEKAALTGTTLNTVPEEPAKRGITIKEALQIPSVAGYCVAFGFMKTINYVRSRRPAVLRCLHAIDATRVHLTMKWVVSFSILRPFGPRRETAMLRAGVVLLAAPLPADALRAGHGEHDLDAVRLRDDAGRDYCGSRLGRDGRAPRVCDRGLLTHPVPIADDHGAVCGHFEHIYIDGHAGLHGHIDRWPEQHCYQCGCCGLGRAPLY